MRPYYQIYLLLFLLLINSCALFVSDEQRAEITKVAFKAHFDSLYAWYDIHPPNEGFMRVIFLQSKYLNDNVVAEISEKLYPNFIALRTDSSDINWIYDTAITSEGKEFTYTKDILDHNTGLPVYIVVIDSIKVRTPRVVSLHLYTADNRGRHYQGSKWWLSKIGGNWKPDSTYVMWEN